MRLQSKGSPYAADGAPTQAGTCLHGACAPVRSILRCRLQGQRHDPLNVSIGDSAGPARPRLVHQSVQSTLYKNRFGANRRRRSCFRQLDSA